MKDDKFESLSYLFGGMKPTISSGTNPNETPEPMTFDKLKEIKESIFSHKTPPPVVIISVKSKEDTRKIVRRAIRELHRVDVEPNHFIPLNKVVMDTFDMLITRIIVPASHYQYSIITPSRVKKHRHRDVKFSRKNGKRNKK